MNRLSWALVIFMIGAASSFGQKEQEWGKGIPFHTKWEPAIKEARETGKLLFIYNGWQKKGI